MLIQFAAPLRSIVDREVTTVNDDHRQVVVAVLLRDISGALRQYKIAAEEANTGDTEQKCLAWKNGICLLRSMKILMSPDSLSFYQLISYTHFELRTEGLSMVRCSCLCVFTRSTLPSPATESLLPNLRGFQCRRFPGCLKKWDGVYSGCKEVTCDTWFPHKSGAVL